jgi:hypothetical protein
VDVSIRAEVLNGVWETFGVDRDVEVDPETVQFSANEWGCEKASWVLKRNPWAAWPDLSPFTPVEIEIGGVVVWIGRTEGTPLKAGAEAQISVQAQGWQFHMDDDLYKRVYVHSMLTDWKDVRSALTTKLSEWPAAPQVQVEAGVITLGAPKGTSYAAGAKVGVYLDLGEAAAKTVSVTFGETTMSSDWSLYLFVCSTVPSEGTELLWDCLADAPESRTVTVTTPERYVLIQAVWNAGPGVNETEGSIKITGVNVFSNETYQSGGASFLISSFVVEDALNHAPLISLDRSQIDPYIGTGQPELEDSFRIPSLVLSSPQTPRQVSEAVNAFHNWVLAVDLERRMVFAPPSSEPEWEIGSWSGEAIEDASASEAADIYDAVIVTGTAANGEPLTVTVTAAELDATTIVGERGFTRAKTISLSNATDEAVMKTIGTVWLQDQLEVPYGGAITAPVGAIRAVLGGQPQHPSLVCRHVNQMLRVSHAVDPSSGGIGRDGRIVAVSYSHAEQTATMTLGARTDSVQALLERLAVTGEVGS